MKNEEIAERLAEGSRQFENIHAQLGEVIAALRTLPEMKADIEATKADSASVKEIVEAWNAVKTGGKFVKWVAPIIGGIVGAWAALKLGINHFIGR
ncbi:MAG: hypothetical protein IE932_00005 [Sphingopyxis terrae]|nr:hypothetical protein [Sphingopyxis terrae]